LFGAPQALTAPVDGVLGGRHFLSLNCEEATHVLEGVGWILIIKSGVVGVAGGIALALSSPASGWIASVLSAVILSLMLWSPAQALSIGLIRTTLRGRRRRVEPLSEHPRVILFLRYNPWISLMVASTAGIVLH
jgi:hypothetical protein